MTRLHQAVGRLAKASGSDERLMATRWVNAWSGAIGERRLARLVAERHESTLPS
ncbi:hypothetical protein [Paraburkholderia sp. J67]|uniref:hypothetical protein n=1 Tax=Paraburkholderia sp. J67 TaxID=2805435 RepID=UPI002ABD4A86|nr:hypothetical protein [Paraburkholderia sp. J67]